MRRPMTNGIGTPIEREATRMERMKKVTMMRTRMRRWMRRRDLKSCSTTAMKKITTMEGNS